MTNLMKRKTRLILETPLDIRGRQVIAHVELAGLKLRLKGCRYAYDISWAQIYNRAALLAAEAAREKRKGGI